jgi:hypothetical protein
MTESTADIIARLQGRLLPRAASPVTVTRKDTDVSSGRANAAQTPGYGAANSLSSRKRGGEYPNTYRPRAKDFAGMLPATTRPAYGGVNPAGGIRINGPATVVRKGERVPSASLIQARANGEDNGMRAEVTRRHNLALASGEMPAPGISKSTPDTRTVALPEIG